VGIKNPLQVKYSIRSLSWLSRMNKKDLLEKKKDMFHFFQRKKIACTTQNETIFFSLIWLFKNKKTNFQEEKIAFDSSF